jgi:hypothetical protein
LADAVSLSWFFGTDRIRVVDSDKDMIDNMIMNLDQKSYLGYWENTPEGLAEAIHEFALLGMAIENCRLK